MGMDSSLCYIRFAVLAFFSLTVTSHWVQKCRRGHPCNIPGPINYHDRIAIVGAGPSGIHMAYLLKKKGFKNIKIFEASNRIGGKSYTINYRKTPHEMGTVYLSPDYEPNIIALAKEFKVGDLVDLPSATVWSNNIPLNFSGYTIRETLSYLKITNVTLAAKTMVVAIERYKLLHLKLFGEYEGELMPRPTEDVLHFIRGTFKEFLQRNNLFILRPLFLVSQTIQGYGQLDELPALYGLIWNTPRLMQGLIARMMNNNSAGIYMLKSGFQTLWEKMAKDLKLHISFYSKVVEVIREDDDWHDEIAIVYRKRYHSRNRYYEEEFDFVMWTPEMKLSLDAIDASRNERDLFCRTRSMYFTTSLVDSWNVPRGYTAIDYWVNLIEGKKNHVVWAQRESYAALKGFGGINYRKGLFPTGDDGLERRTTIVYQMGRYRPSRRKIHRKLTLHFKKMGGQVSIRKTRIWRYFPRYNVHEIRRGILWEIVRMQGREKMWYLGSSVIFESVKSVVEYNELLVDIMEPPGDWRRRRNSISRSGNSTSKSGNSTSRSGNSTLRNGSSASRNGNSASRSGISASKGGNSTSRKGNSTSRNGSSTSRSGNSTTRSGNSTKRSGNSTKRNGNSSVG